MTVTSAGRGTVHPERKQPLSQTTSGFGMIVFLASDLMLFAAFFSAYFLLRSVNADWPSPLAELDTPRAALATAALIVSSVTMIAADRSLMREQIESYRRWLWATIVLGAGFFVNQLIEYRALPFKPSSDAYGSIYWTLTGLHAAHVFVGVCALSLLLVRSRRSAQPGDLHSWSWAISAFWHVVDVVWIAVFLTIWIIR